MVRVSRISSLKPKNKKRIPVTPKKLDPNIFEMILTPVKRKDEDTRVTAAQPKKKLPIYANALKENSANSRLTSFPEKVVAPKKARYLFVDEPSVVNSVEINKSPMMKKCSSKKNAPSKKCHHLPIEKENRRPPIYQICCSPIEKENQRLPVDKEKRRSPVEKDNHRSPGYKDIQGSPIAIDIRRSPIREEVRRSPIEVGERTPNYGEELQNCLKMFCEKYENGMQAKRKKIEQYTVGVLTTNDRHIGKLVQEQLADRRILAKEFRAKVYQEIRDCHQEVQQHLARDAKLIEQLKSERDRIGQSRQFVLEKVTRAKNACKEYVGVLENLNDKHEKQYESFRSELRKKLDEMQNIRFVETQRKELADMRNSFERILSPKTGASEEY